MEKRLLGVKKQVCVCVCVCVLPTGGDYRIPRGGPLTDLTPPEYPAHSSETGLSLEPYLNPRLPPTAIPLPEPL
jgi:hypothetical protein